MTARGAADFLTRATSILGAAFIVLSILLAAIAGATGDSRRSIPRWRRPVTAPLPRSGAGTAPAAPQQAPGVPLAQ